MSSPPLTAHRPMTAMQPLVLLLSLASLHLLTLFVGPSRGQDLFLHAASYPVLQGLAPVSFATAANQGSVAGVSTSAEFFHIKAQEDGVAGLSEVRWGLFFDGHKSSISRLRSGDPWPGQVMMLPVGDSLEPVLVEHTSSHVGLLSSMNAFPLPGASAELLAGIAVSDESVEVLGVSKQAAGSEGSVFMGNLTPASLNLKQDPVIATAGLVVAAPGIGRTFFLGNGDRLLAANWQRNPVVDSLNVSSDIRDLAATRFFSTAADCPDGLDVVVLLESGTVLVYQCYDLWPDTSFTSVASPVRPSPAEGRILAPPGRAMADSTAPFYLVLAEAVDARDRLWMAVAHAGEFSWRRVILPPGFADDLEDLQLVRLKITATGSGEWTLVSGNTALFPPEVFGCGTDHTIVCEDGTPPISSSRGWSCALGHAASPFVSPAFLCAGCADGWYLDRPTDGAPFSQPDHVCRPCPYPHCRTCSADGCLVCEDSFFPENSGQYGQTLCVETCSVGFTEIAGTCQPRGLSPTPLSITVPLGESLPGLPSGVTVVAIGPTWLSVDGNSSRPIIPRSPGLGSPPPGVLLFASSRSVYFLPASAIGQLTKPPLQPVSLLGSSLNADFRSFAEAGPFLHNGRLSHLLLMCTDGGFLFLAWLNCEPGEAAMCVSEPAYAEGTFISGCIEVRRLDAGRALVLTSDQAQFVLEADPSTKTVLTEVVQGVGFVNLFAPGETSAGRANPALGDWLLWSTFSGRATVSPWSLLGSDSRKQAITGALLPGMPDEGSLFAPVLLPRGAGAWPELILTKAQGPEWLVLQVPGDMLPAGRSIDLAYSRHVLGVFPQGLANPVGGRLDALFQGVALPNGGPEYPSVLLVLARAFLGASLLRCPDGVAGRCALQPAVFVSLPAELRLASGTGPWLPVIAQAGPGPSIESAQAPPRGTILTLLLLSPSTGQLVFSLDNSCPVGTYGDVCRACDGTCLGCSGPGPGACTSCSAGQLLHGGACVGVCPGGMWPDVGAGVCRACPVGCLACQSPTHCTACGGAFFRADNSCWPCHGSCAECANGSSCLSCKVGLIFLEVDELVDSLCGSTCPPGEFVGSDRCTECAASCELCVGSATACQVCARGFRWASKPAPGAPGACVPCSQGCQSCTVDGCLACEPALLLAPGADACVPACPPGSWANGESCQPCDLSCRTCVGGESTECTGCDVGLELLDSAPGVGTCVSGCGDGQFRDPVSGQCVPCAPACATCNGPTDRDCWRCKDALLQDDGCVQHCATRHVAVNGRCLPCHASCAACTGVRSTECTTCLGGLLALAPGPLPVRCVEACPVGYNTSDSGCTACRDHCATCPSAPGTCAQCERGWFLDQAACVDACPGGTFSMGSLCAGCHETCATCFGLEADQCLACGASAPLAWGNRCYAACPGGTYQSGLQCLPCHGTCAMCSGPGANECTGCHGSGVRLNGSCLAGCPRGYFPQGDLCVECHASCGACDGPGHCTDCLLGHMLQPDGACVADCPVGWLGCRQSKRCVACPPGCLACEASGSTCEPLCTVCDPEHVLSAGACLSFCPVGEFQPPGSGFCRPCAGTCSSCFEAADRCTGCHVGLLHPAEGTCAGACSGSLVPVKGVCLGCFAGCEACEAPADQPECELHVDGSLACPDVATCRRCEPGLLLLGVDLCVGSCPVGFFPEADGAVSPACLPCHVSCRAGCVGPAASDCQQPPGSTGSRVGLVVGLSVGLLLLAILLVVAVVIWVYRRRGAATSRKAPDTEDATMLNTIVELALPGTILVDMAVDFVPEPGEAIGAGSQASVVAARAIGAGISARLGCPEVVAIKVLKAEGMKPTHVSMFQNEVALMWLLRDHGTIVRLYGYSQSPPAIVMERFEGDLSTLLHSEVVLSPVQLADICRQWATGLEAMHAHGVAHCDLKSGNVFVSPVAGSWRAALGDLGTSKNLNTDRSSALITTVPKLNAMSARYAAPELLAAFRRGVSLEPGLFFPADIYAGAILLNECLTRTVPWAGMSLQHIADAVQTDQRPVCVHSSHAAEGLVQAAWQTDPERRPLAATFRQQCAALFVAAGGLNGS
ncbi:TKL protein kinase [Fonticula alba]|uniref:TKL protein kinase n=1 Tax=Fonticula alba TaxID=691883 RepID=A0A058Z978_FONAL|nr:TKL protein kinase [Fonticula alba]KCV70869.1 TKL protein kinase [Fonticula alba]|eukprot:XP_009495385.1 TKL protein kinase [Fonticula alba]